MSVETSTSTSSSGSTTTIGTTVRNEGGGGGDPHVVDVFLSLDATKLQHESAGSPYPASTAHSEASLMCWWKELTVQPDSEIRFDYKVKWRSTLPLFSTATGFVIVFDRTSNEVHYNEVSIARSALIIRRISTRMVPKPGPLTKRSVPRREASSKSK